MSLSYLVNSVLMELGEETLYGENIPLSPLNTHLQGPKNMKTYDNIPLTDSLVKRLHSIVDPDRLFEKEIWLNKLRNIMKFTRDIHGVICGLADSPQSIKKDLHNPVKLHQAQAVLNMFDDYTKRHTPKPDTTIINKTGIPPRGYY